MANAGETYRAAAERNVTSLLRHRRRKRSVSVERNVETLIVVDRSMMDYYKNEDIENYVLTIINMVQRPRNTTQPHRTRPVTSRVAYSLNQRRPNTT